MDCLFWMVKYKRDFLSLEDYKTLLAVSKTARGLIMENIESIILHILRLVFNNGEKSSRYWFKHVLYPSVKKGLGNDMRVTIKQMLKNTKNWIKNPSCSQGFNDWTIVQDGGSGWTVGDWPHLLPIRRFTQKAFCGSYSHCVVEQKIDLSLLKEQIGKEPCSMEAGAYTSRRWDCGCTATVKIVLTGEDDKPTYEAERTVSEELPTEGPFTKGYCFKLISFKCFDYKVIMGAKQAILTLSTRDEKMWSGQFAARFTDMYVRFIPLSYYAKPPLTPS